MALSRRTGQRFQASIWPGFVDAMTGLLLVLMFVLTIFMVVQFVLRETITGQESELSQLTAEIAEIAEALGLEREKVVVLERGPELHQVDEVGRPPWGRLRGVEAHRARGVPELVPQHEGSRNVLP